MSVSPTIERKQSSFSKAKALSSFRRRASLSSLPDDIHRRHTYSGPQPVGLKSCLSSSPRSEPECDSASPRSVSFSNIESREYGIEIGDNPSVRSGVPITLSWEYDEQASEDIDSYELSKECESTVNPLSSEWRELLLITIVGKSQESLEAAAEDARKLRKQRMITVAQLGGPRRAHGIGPKEHLLIAQQSLARKYLRFCKGTSSSEEQRILWEEAQLIAAQNNARDDENTTSTPVP